MSLLARLFSKVSVLACDSCEGASGAILDLTAGTVRVCPACHGRGEGGEPTGASLHYIAEEREGRRRDMGQVA